MRGTLPLPPLDGLVEALRSREPALSVGGVVPAARGMVLASLLRQAWPEDGPVVVVVPRAADAAEVAACVALLAPGARVAAVPSEGSAPYLGAEPPLAASASAARALARVGRGELDVLAVPARALAARIPSPREVVSLALTLEQGMELDLHELSQRLTVLGFRRVDLVEEAGEFAIRGAVADVHPGGDAALRLELDDVAVDSMRPFDPATQRRGGEPVESVELLPLQLFPPTEDRLQALARLLTPDLPVLAELVRSNSERRLWWAALGLVGETVSWLEVGGTVVVCDRDEVLGELARWHTVQEREWQAQAARHLELPSPERLLVASPDIRSRVEGARLAIERVEIQDGTTRWWRVATHPGERFARRLPDLVPTLRKRRAEDLAQILVVASERAGRRFAGLLAEGGVDPVPGLPAVSEVAIVCGELEEGFVWDGGLAVYGRRDLTATPRSRASRRGLAAFVSDLRDLKPGDLVVHVDHGIGRFTGFRRVQLEGLAHEMMVLEYRGGDHLLVPVERADLIQKYQAGDQETSPPLDRLGSTTWRRRKARVREAVRELAAELLRLAAVRRSVRGHAFSPDSPWQREFEDAFEYELTPDQERVVAEIKTDMEDPLPMDRLLCGDVGFGKTEVAIRAAFKAVLDGKQVLVLAPTTILAGQHLDTFRRRFAGFPVEIRMLSRFVSRQEAAAVLKGLAEGTVDIVVGTHRLLAADVELRDPGLVIIDEEQRFGVAQKERLKRLRAEVDVLSMSATPIPRTLNMALTGLRDIGLIETPPRDRQAVETTVLEFSEEVVREAILFELERGGQVFYVHNRVRSIGAFAQWLRRAVPEARVVVAHGQMAEGSLEKAMRTFLGGEADVLLATAIIENGLDIPNANTLLVNRADRFGLAQLYQLRGRVGRSDRLAFAYFLIPPGTPLSPPARARLAALEEFCELGSGFRIAARDLEIRGAGNVLGAEQHGFLEAVGFETYSQLLEEAVAELEGQPSKVRREVELSLGLDLQLPADYLPEPSLRLSFYKRLAAVSSPEQLVAFAEEMRDRYGPEPTQLELLLQAQELRLAAREAGVTSIVRRGGMWRLRVEPAAGPPPGLMAALEAWPDARLTPAGEIVLPDGEGAAGVGGVLELVRRLGEE